MTGSVPIGPMPGRSPLMKCARCGASNPETAKFCAACGAVSRAYCERCGQSSPEGSRFCIRCGAQLSAEVHGKPSPERRQISILFCDLVDSVRWTHAMDPEDWLRVLRRYQDCARRCIRDNHGRITRYFGDGILAVFGYPAATERDAEAAVRAGLAIAEAVPQLEVPPRVAGAPRLQVRTGIATGDVVVGDIIGDGAAEEETVVGDAINLAARLQSRAPPNSVVVDAATRELFGELFECRDLGAQELKGFARPVRSWEVTSPGTYESLFRASHRRRITAMVNRDEELAHIDRCWRRASEGAGQVVVIGGEPGIGKSRIAEAVHQRLSEPHARLVYQCSPMHTTSALAPIVAHLQFAAGIRRSDSDETQWAKLLSAVGGSEQQREEARMWLAELLGIAAPPGAPQPDPTLDARERRGRIIETCRDQVRAWSESRPLLLVIEDVQWIDPTTLELVDLIVADVQTLPVLLLVTHRPEFVPPWLDRPHVSARALHRLTPDDAAKLVDRVQGGAELPRALAAQVVKRTDGIPLFVEEMTAAIVGAGLERRPDAGVRRGEAIPSTLKGSLMARLDALAEARKLAQVASVIGREFAYYLICAVVDWSEQQLAVLLERLLTSGLVFAQGEPPDATYMFKHALVRDVAYGTLLRSERRQCHLRIARALESRFPEFVTRHPEVVAQHYSAGQAVDKAAEYWLIAGKRAAARSLTVEAVTHLTTALRLLRRLPRTASNLQRELELRVVRGPALLTTRGAATRSVRHNYDRALELCGQLEESELHFAAYWGSLRIDESYSSKLKRVEGLQSLAERLGDPGYVLQAHHRQWATVFHIGRHAECLEHVRVGLHLYDEGDYRDHGLRYAGHDPKVCGHGEAALSLWLIGRPEEALRHLEQALAWAEELGHSGSIVHAMDIAAMLHRYRRDVGALERQAEAMQRFAQEHRMHDHVSKSRIFLAWTAGQQGRVEEAVAALSRELDSQRRTNTPEDFPVFFESLSEMLGLAGAPEQALEVIGEALEIAGRNDILYWSAELHRRRGEVLRLIAGRGDESRSCFERALGIARRQRARSLELRAAISLGRHLLDGGQADKARATLAAALDGFAAAQDSDDLREARVLMARRP